jgi:hypothetical protein
MLMVTILFTVKLIISEFGTSNFTSIICHDKISACRSDILKFRMKIRVEHSINWALFLYPVLITQQASYTQKQFLPALRLSLCKYTSVTKCMTSLLNRFVCYKIFLTLFQLSTIKGHKLERTQSLNIVKVFLCIHIQ